MSEKLTDRIIVWFAERPVLFEFWLWRIKVSWLGTIEFSPGWWGFCDTDDDWDAFVQGLTPRENWDAIAEAEKQWRQ